MKASVGNAVLTPSAGIDVDTLTWRVLAAADGARCELYLYYVKDGVAHGNQTAPATYHVGATNRFVVQLAPDQHQEIATYTLGCWLGSGSKHWATPGQVTVQ